jgi:hypothetical protein
MQILSRDRYQTTSGIPKKAPLTMLEIPENSNVDVKEMLPDAARAVITGMRVPKSPNDPAISPKGSLKRVLQLYFID